VRNTSWTVLPKNTESFGLSHAVGSSFLRYCNCTSHMLIGLRDTDLEIRVESDPSHRRDQVSLAVHATNSKFDHRGGTLIQHCMAPTLYIVLELDVHIRDTAGIRHSPRISIQLRTSHALPSLRLLVVLRINTRVAKRVAAVVPLKVDSQAGRVLQVEKNSVRDPSPKSSRDQNGESPLTLTYLYPVNVSGAFPFSTQSTIRNKTLFCAVCSVPFSSAAFCPIPQAPTPPEQ
jgi:hypothetical protein